LNLLGESNFEDVQKPSLKDHLPIYGTCVGMPIWNNQKKVQGLGLVCNLLGKVGSIKDNKSKWKDPKTSLKMKLKSMLMKVGWEQRMVNSGLD